MNEGRREERPVLGNFPFINSMPMGGIGSQLPSNFQQMPMEPANSQPPRIAYNQIGLNHILKHPPPFFFQERVGAINWEEIYLIDIDKIVRNVDLTTLEVLIYFTNRRIL